MPITILFGFTFLHLLLKIANSWLVACVTKANVGFAAAIDETLAIFITLLSYIEFREPLIKHKRFL